MIKCVTQKRVYVSNELAEEALLGAHIRFDYSAGKGPVAVYRCEDCGYFHLTSKGPINTSLAAHLKSGNIKRQQEADAWERKLKH